MGYRVFRSELEDLRTRAGVFEQVAAMLSGGKNLTGAEHPQRLEIAVVSANYFSMLGTSAHIGRVFGPCNEVPGYGEAIAISDSLVGPRVRQTQAWCCVELSIQQTNAVKGTIRDSSGAMMQNVAVATEDTERGIRRTAITDSVGKYRITDLPPANYDVSVAMPGFESQVQKSLMLNLGETLVVDFHMKVSAGNEVVEVTSEALVVDTARAHRPEWSRSGPSRSCRLTGETISRFRCSCLV